MDYFRNVKLSVTVDTWDNLEAEDVGTASLNILWNFIGIERRHHSRLECGAINYIHYLHTWVSRIADG